MISRDKEEKILGKCLMSDKPEFIAVYGRRRVGKTFLIREFFAPKPVVFLNITGSKDAPLFEQLKHFNDSVAKAFYQGAPLKELKSWDEAFQALTNGINSQPKTKKVVLFFDEFPWMVTPKSRLLENLGYYWNQYWSRDKRIKLIVCGSSASWIMDKIINNKGGLHNRITMKILLEPFKLADTKHFLSKSGIKLNNRQIVQIYMATGGVPYYLSYIKKGLSAGQNIEQLAFTSNGILLNEFDNLFASLFSNHTLSVEMVLAIASQRYGMAQEELLQTLKIKGKVGLDKLKELEDAGFIMSFTPYQHTQKGRYYKVVDEYTLFYLKWIKPIKRSLIKGRTLEGYWEKQQNSSSWYSWAGLAFESICYKHLDQISRALGLKSTALPNAWRCKANGESGAQIDLLFDRADNAITLCEIKFTDRAFVIDKQYAKELLHKQNMFIKKTRTTKEIFWAMIASQGVAEGVYADELIDGVVTVDDLFV